MLIISAVYPFPRHSGQQQRVYYKLKAFHNHFNVTFLTVSPKEKVSEVRTKLLTYCDEAIVLPSRYTQNIITRWWHRLLGFIYHLFTGLKFSNYLLGNLEFTYQRIKPFITKNAFDSVLFEYWHAHKTARQLRKDNIITILDMHDLLWQSYTRQWEAKKWAPKFIKKWFSARYRKREEKAWEDFDVLIAINKAELDYTRNVLGDDAVLLYAPMGTDLTLWPYCWKPAHSPRRIAFFGGLGSLHNQQDARICYHEIMPKIWEQFPQIEYWIVGSNPPQDIQDLQADKRVHVTGYVKNVQDVLKTMSLVLCPWSGTYGFRSRVVEVMALGVPVVASQDAIYGMGFELNKGICVGEKPANLAQLAIALLSREDLSSDHSQSARKQVEEKFSYEVTYGRLSHELLGFLEKDPLNHMD